RAGSTNNHSAWSSKPMSTIEERVKKIVVEQLGVKEEEVTNSASFVDDLGADSLDTVELVMALEEEFECEIPDEEAEKITSVQQAIDYIKAHVKSARAPCPRTRVVRGDHIPTGPLHAAPCMSGGIPPACAIPHREA